VTNVLRTMGLSRVSGEMERGEHGAVTASKFSWPDDHPAVLDAALRPYAAGAAALCPPATPAVVLKYQPGRRVTTAIGERDLRFVLKVYATHRAHKSAQRLRAFAASEARGLVPAVVGVDASGHACLLEYIEGTPIDQLDPDQFAAACRLAGVSLRALHRSAAALERAWLLEDEIRQLRRSCGPATHDHIEQVIAGVYIRPRPLVPSHRDCYPAQAVIDGGVVRWIDLDDSARAPAGLDVGNFIGHVIAQFGPATTSTRTDVAIDAFLDGYGDEPPDVAGWVQLTLARLTGLSEVRGKDLIAFPTPRLDMRSREEAS